MAGRAQLMLVLGLGLLLGGLSLSMNRWARSANSNGAYFYEALTSHNLALAGAQVGIEKVTQDTTWYGSNTYQENTSGGSYTVTRNSSTPLLVESVSTYTTLTDVMHDTVDVYFAYPGFTSFTLFSWMSNNEGPCQWVTGDSVQGRLHSNGPININGSPVFNDLVTTVHSFSPPPGHGVDQAIFKKQFRTGVDSIYFPNSLLTVFDSASTGGRFYNVPTIWVTLNGGNPAVAGDGYALVRTSASGPVLDSIPIASSGFNGVIMGNQTVHVQGTVDGQVTVSSNLGSIVVEDNLLYERDPRFDTTSTDLLGLVAEDSVIIADNAANATDCIVQGNIFARTGSLSAQDYDNGVLRGRLTVLGSIVQNVRGAVGTNLNGVLNSGYYKSYAYDTRLYNPTVRPPMYPGFVPAGGMVVGWWESLRVPDFSKYE
ncbi:MAG TPA: hypothetical protein VL221_07930 [Bacteroidota bacterium]|nr:hypothetical protein [Bacteroidota bacterium]